MMRVKSACIQTAVLCLLVLALGFGFSWAVMAQDSAGLVAAYSASSVRFSAPGAGAAKMQIEIKDLQGKVVYDSGVVAANSVEWQRSDRVNDSVLEECHFVVTFWDENGGQLSRNTGVLRISSGNIQLVEIPDVFRIPDVDRIAANRKPGTPELATTADDLQVRDAVGNDTYIGLGSPDNTLVGSWYLMTNNTNIPGYNCAHCFGILHQSAPMLPRLTIDTNGWVGIATPTPAGPFHVDFGATGRLIAGTPLGNGPGLIFTAPNGHRRDLVAGNVGYGICASVDGGPCDPNRFIIDENGWVGIGAAPTGPLTVDFGATGKVVTATPQGAGPGFVFQAANGHRRDMTAHNAGISFCASSSSATCSMDLVRIEESGALYVNNGIGVGGNLFGASAPLHLKQSGAGTSVQARLESNAGYAQHFPNISFFNNLSKVAQLISDVQYGRMLFDYCSSCGGDFTVRRNQDSGDPADFVIHGNAAGNTVFGGITAQPGYRVTVIGGLYATGSITANSDRNLKENFAMVDAREALRKVIALQVPEWNFKDEGKSARHIGPMAQDFHAAFGLGSSEKGISPLDGVGVSLLAIQALYGLNQEKDSQIRALQQEVEMLKAQLQAILERLETPKSR